VLEVRLGLHKVSVLLGLASACLARCLPRSISGGTSIPTWRSYMSLLSLILALISVGVVLWLINNYIPMDGKIKSILNAVVVIFVVLWLLQQFSVFSAYPAFRLQH
jgi:cation transporter-like permease